MINFVQSCLFRGDVVTCCGLAPILLLLFWGFMPTIVVYGVNREGLQGVRYMQCTWQTMIRAL